MINFEYTDSTYEKIKVNKISRPILSYDLEVYENAKFIRNATDNITLHRVNLNTYVIAF